MKTTIELPDSLLIKAKALAKRRKTSLRSVMEEALRRMLISNNSSSNYHFPNCSVNGKGPVPAFTNTNWETWRAAAYGERE